MNKVGLAMRASIRVSTRVCLFGLLVAAGVALAETAAGADAAEQARAPEAWLDEMNRAFRDLDYDGVFSYYGGSELATLRVVHMVVDGVQRERLVHLNGAPREIIRTGDEVACILHPGDEILELEASIPAGPFARAFARRFDAVGDLYTITLHGSDRIANREAVRLAVAPRDDHRYGYRLWLDAATGLLLRSELRDMAGTKLEIFQFATLTVGDIPLSALDPVTRDGTATSHFWLNTPPPIRDASPMNWRARWVPVGFSMASADVRRTRANLKVVNTLMFTDGLAAFSVYIEAMPPAGAGNLESRNGATVAVTHLAPGPSDRHHLVTVVGEVPTPTARKIAESIYYER
ncbi:MAG: MucB/RseB C-terminal domain-containing protein [Gammaproteobacteria bacterium]|nr:MucB/RseB C-terminal domain-containing protein [Gammaproteobacteria bacterium]